MKSPVDSNMNKLYFGDNLEIMQKYIKDESVDLIYLDPPFNSDRAYNVIFKDKTGKKSASQIQAFEDTWYWKEETQDAFDEIMNGSYSAELKDMMRSFVEFMGRSNLMAYLTMMAIRLTEMHRILKSTGSIYLHCDPTASHYIKILMDHIFDIKNFRNEIIWRRSQPKSHIKNRFSNSHDVILTYTKSQSAYFKPLYIAHDPEYLKKFYKYIEEGTGRRYKLGDLTNPNKNRPNLTYEFPPGSGNIRVWRWTKERMLKAWKDGRVILQPNSKIIREKGYLDEMSGSSVTDLWSDIEHLHGSHNESMGYPTQKPVALLERIIESSSEEGGMVLDPFCGCGTAIAAAEKLGRNWIGIDITFLAIALIKKRINDHFPDAKFEVIGEPRSLEDARALFNQSPFQFESWAVSLMGGQPFKSTGGGDTGIDGFLYFHDIHKKYYPIIIEVKGGKYQPKDIRALKAVMDRENAPLGVLIALHKPTGGMEKEAAALGKWEVPGTNRKCPVLQIVTIEELFAGKDLRLPDTSSTLKKAKREIREKEKQQKFL
ncbi:MAG: site-specific DNA-methyltransferase [candidate division Zixibacteria bacterium HGW-Zixibacteria-1]|nr:MAG: site-specific DNA-methyltransferase [candidate division Zixibacteria bacterium HGW-Zixibacteria-1]